MSKKLFSNKEIKILSVNPYVKSVSPKVITLKHRKPEEALPLGKGIHDKQSQLEYISNRIKMLSNVVDTVEPDNAQIEDLDRMIEMLDDLKFKCNQFRRDWVE